MSDELPPPPSEHEAGEPIAEGSPSHGRGARLALIAGIVVIVLAIAAAAGAYFMMRGSPEEVLTKVPASADVVVVAHLDPSASQKMNLFRMAGKFPSLGSREQLTRHLDEWLDQALTDSGLTHDDLSWVGGEAGGYVDLSTGTPSFAILFAADDEAGAKAAMQKIRDADDQSYTTTTIDGVEVFVADSSDHATMAIVDGVAVFAGGQDAMTAVIDTSHGAASVETDPVFQGVLDRLPEDNLGFAFVNVQEVTKLLTSLPGVVSSLPDTAGQLEGAQGVGMSLSAGSDGLAVDMVTTTDPSKLTREQLDQLAASDGPNPMLDLVPKNAYTVMAINGLASGLEQSIEQAAQLDPGTARMIEKLHLTGPHGVLSHLTGNLAVQVGPGSGLLPIGGSVLIGVDDTDAVRSWLDTNLQTLIAGADPFGGSGGFAWRTEEYSGVTITYLNPLDSPASLPIAYAVVDRAVVIATSVNGVEDAVDLQQDGGGITTAPGYTAATNGMPGTETVVYVDVQAILSAVQAIVPSDAYREFQDAGGKNLEPITVVVAGSESDENGSTSRLLIQIP
jgi:hypothetical protein